MDPPAVSIQSEAWQSSPPSPRTADHQRDRRAIVMGKRLEFENGDAPLLASASERNGSVARPAAASGAIVPRACLIDLDIAAIERAVVQSIDGLFRFRITGHLDKSESLRLS